MDLFEKHSMWTSPTNDPFVHPVKKLCFRSASPISDNLSLQTRTQPLTPQAQECPRSCVRSLDCLGEDLLLHVLRLAQPTAWDLCRMACVSKRWRSACYNPFFWTKLRVGPGSMRPGVEQLSLRCQTLKELHVDDPRCELHILHPIVVACGPSLRRVSVNCDMDSTGLTSQNEASICSILWIVSLYCKNVESIELLSDGLRCGFSYLETKVLWFLTSGFRNIRSFASLCQESITKQSLYLMVIAWRDLTCLRIHSGLLRKDDLTSLRKCHSLRALELVGGKLANIFGERCIHPRLEVLILNNVHVEPETLPHLSKACPGLQRILVSRESWVHGGSVQEMALRRSKLRRLQPWFKSSKNVDLVLDD